jgi:hypothetical protein
MLCLGKNIKKERTKEEIVSEKGEKTKDEGEIEVKRIE